MGKAPSFLRGILSAIVYPALMAGSVWAACAALDAGVESAVVVPVINVAAAVLVLSLERALPYRAVWNRSFGDVRTDALHTAFNGLAGWLGQALVTFALTLASVRLSAALATGLWPSRWPLAAQLALALPLSELGIYWLHRIEHRG